VTVSISAHPLRPLLAADGGTIVDLKQTYPEYPTPTFFFNIYVRFCYIFTITPPVISNYIYNLGTNMVNKA